MADSTTKKYLGAFQRWKTWAEARRGVPSFPVQDIHLVLYLQHLSESIQSKSAVEEAVHAVSWLHQMAGLPSIAGSPIVQATLGGLRRELAKPKKRKEPVTAEMLLAMVCRSSWAIPLPYRGPLNGHLPCSICWFSKM